jgi:signal transduction histidine kinase
LAGNSSDIQEECDMIARSIQYSQILLRRLLDYLDTGQPRLELIDTLVLLKRVELLARPRLSSNIQLKVTIDHSIKQRTVSANFEQLMGVLLELVYNAASALRDKGGSIELYFEERDREIAIFVNDDGPGIPGELRKKLFKKQVPSKEGLGLGLFLCNKVVNALGGKLSMQTSSEEGTTFTILLPIAGDEKEP